MPPRTVSNGRAHAPRRRRVGVASVPAHVATATTRASLVAAAVAFASTVATAAIAPALAASTVYAVRVE